MTFPSGTRNEAFRCSCGREVFFKKGNENTRFVLNGCACGRTRWNLPAGVWFDVEGGPIYIYPRESDLADPRD